MNPAPLVLLTEEEREDSRGEEGEGGKREERTVEERREPVCLSSALCECCWFVLY